MISSSSRPDEWPSEEACRTVLKEAQTIVRDTQKAISVGLVDDTEKRQDPANHLEKMKNDALKKIQDAKQLIRKKKFQCGLYRSLPEKLEKWNEVVESELADLDKISEFFEQSILLWQGSPFMEEGVLSSLSIYFKLRERQSVDWNAGEGYCLREKISKGVEISFGDGSGKRFAAEILTAGIWDYDTNFRVL